MSIIAKQAFLREVSDQISHKMCGDDVTYVIGVLTDQMSRFDMERVESETDRQEYSEMLELFLNAKKVEGRSPKTIERYRYVVNRLFEKVKTPIQDITVFHLRKYLMSEKERGISDSTIAGDREVFSSFFSWLHNEGLIRDNPCANLKTVKCRKEMRLPFTSKDIDKLKASCETYRDKAIVTFLLATGCRIGEACALNREDVDIRNYECTVLGKGNKERTVYLDKVSAMHLENYLYSRTDEENPLFVGKGNRRLLAGGVRKRLNEIAEIAGVENVHPHRFRRTLATNLIKHGMPIQEVAMILGHEKIDTTMRYVYLDGENIKHSYKKYI